jgi:nitrate reductase gamma subunit
MTTKRNKWPQNIPTLAFSRPSKVDYNSDFFTKIYHLATLVLHILNRRIISDTSRQNSLRNQYFAVVVVVAVAVVDLGLNVS